MSKIIRKYGIEATYVQGGKATIWYFTENQRNRMIFRMKEMPDITRVRPVKRK